MERVLHVVQVADLQIPVHRVELLRGEHHVLHLGAAHSFDPDVERSPGERLGDDADEPPVREEAGVDLDDDAEHVLAVQEDRAGIGESELVGSDRRQGGSSIHDERIPPRPGEDPQATPGATLRIVDAEGDRLSRRTDAGALLLRGRRVLGAARSGLEDTVDDDLLVSWHEPPPGVVRGRPVERSQPEAVQQPVGEHVGRPGHRQGVQDQHETPRLLGARERVHVRDVRDRVRQGTWPGDVVRHDNAPSRCV